MSNDDEEIKKQKELDEEYQNKAMVYNRMASDYYREGDYKTALIYDKKALDILENTPGAKDSDRANFCNNIAATYRSLGDYKTALNYDKTALKILKKTPELKYFEIANIYNDIASTYKSLGNYKQALKYNIRALKIGKKYGLDNFSKATFYINTAEIYRSLGGYEKALKYNKKALKIREEILGLEHPDTATVYSNLAGVYSNLYNYEIALIYYKKALKIEEKILGLEHPYTAAIYSNLAGIYNNIGDYKSALVYNKKAIIIWEKQLSTEHSNIANNYNNLAGIYNSLGNYTVALLYCKKALKIAEKVLGSEHPYTATIYNDLAGTYSNLHNYETALVYYEKALNIREKLFGFKHFYTAIIYNNLAETYLSLRDYKKALKYSQIALKIRKKTNYLDMANSYNTLAGIYNNLKNYESALKSSQKALKIQKDVLGEVHPYTIIIYNNLAEIYNSLGNYEVAYKHLVKVIKISIKQREANFSFMDTESKKKYMENKSIYFDDFFSITQAYLTELQSQSNIKKTKQIYKEIYPLWLQEKGTLQDEETFLGILYENTEDKNLKQKIEKLKSLKFQYAKLLNSMTGEEGEKQRLEQLQEKISKLEQYLSEHIQRFKQETEFNNLTHQDIAKNLGSDELFIDFAEGEENYYFFTLNNKAELTFTQVDKEDTLKIKEQIKAFIKNTKEMQKLYENQKSMNTERFTVHKEKLEKESKIILFSLYTLLIEKYLKVFIDHYAKLTISPDGLLNLLPFDALYDGEEYLLKQKDIYYISSARELVRINRFGIDEKEVRENITVFADPDYDFDQDQSSQSNDGEDDFDISRSSRAVKKFTKVKPLKGTKEEAEVISKIFKKESLVYTRVEANEEHFKQQSNSHILHIATHGIVVKNDEEKEPLLKTALALTGYNASIEKKKDYGVLTGLKIASLDLTQTELVVLSACETAVGESDHIVGVSSLSRAFMLAGAKSTIASFWEVEDEGTKTFFEAFYKKIKTQKNYAEAFKETQRQMYEQNKASKDHPLFWAGFAFFGSV